MSNYSNGNKTITSITDYDAYVKVYIDKKYNNITSNFKDNKIKSGNLDVNLNYKLEDVNNLIFLSNDTELVIVLLDKDKKNLYYINIFNKFVKDSKNSVNLGNIITFEWNTKSTNYMLLYVILGISIFLILSLIIYLIVRENNSKNIIND